MINSYSILPSLQTIYENLGHNLVNNFSGKTILITGGGGFLGKYFVEFFKHMNNTGVLLEPCKIVILDNYITGTTSKADSNVSEIQIDISKLKSFPPNSIDYIIHLAGIASPFYYMKYPLETIDVAVKGTRNLLDIATDQENLQGFLYFSSSEIYGNPDVNNIPTTEDYLGYVSCTGPRACYDESKRLGETLCSIYYDKYNVPATIVRPFNVFGPGMGHNDRRVIPMFTYEALNNRPLSIHDNGEQTRTFCYITDAINGFIRALVYGENGQAYNIGNSDNEISMRGLAELYIKLLPKVNYNLIDYPDTYPAGEPQRRCPDLNKAEEDLSYFYHVPLEEGLKDFIEWAAKEDSYND
jgi:UDP-glucuronate decarboxylase